MAVDTTDPDRDGDEIVPVGEQADPRPGARGEPAAGDASTDLEHNGVTTNKAPHLVADDDVSDVVRDAQLCPHCRQPIALVTLLLTRTAAHVTVPDPPRTHTRRPRSWP